MSIKQIEKSGFQAIKNLRENKLKNGQPFMINSNTLPAGQCYLEYPDGSIVLAAINRTNFDFEVILKYSPKEGSRIRKKFMLA